MIGNRRDYVIPETAERVRNALKQLEETISPGQHSGKGGRMDVMREVKEDVSRLIEKGYTAHQIAEAINRGDIFKILPKSITQLVNETGSKIRTGLPKPTKQTVIKRSSQNETSTEHVVNEKGKQIPGRHGTPISRPEVDGTTRSEIGTRKPAEKRFAGPRPDRE